MRTSSSVTQPHIIQILCDDLGYGDTGYNGHPRLRTPHLDALAAGGMRLDRFHAGGPVCSPTRGTCLTGRHYIRYGINHANVGRLPEQELTLPSLLREQGYITGHFGKWHLGTLEKNYSSKPNRDPARNFAPPWLRGYDESFATESRVPTWDPQLGINKQHQRTDEVWGSPYYDNGTRVTESLTGCDSQIIMDRALSFLDEAISRDQPSFSTIWFHAPHSPVVAGPEWLAQYADCELDEAHYYGCVSAMDHQIGRLVSMLRERGVLDHTMLWFASDNGPEGSLDIVNNGRNRGCTGGLRGRKRSLYQGGVVVPALLHWPERISPGTSCQAPLSTLDYMPTILSWLNIPLPDRPFDGMDVRPLLMGERERRNRPIPFRFLSGYRQMFGSPTLALFDDDYVFYTNLSTHCDEDELYVLTTDRAQEQNRIAEYTDKAQTYRTQLTNFMASCRQSHAGQDYHLAPGEEFDPVTEFQAVGDWGRSR